MNFKNVEGKLKLDSNACSTRGFPGRDRFVIDLIPGPTALLEPRPRPEGSYKIGFVRPSFCLSLSFLRIGSLNFSETWYGVRGPYIVVCDTAGFFGKSS